MKDVKFYPNPNRKEVVIKPYKPAYQTFGVEPTQMSPSSIPAKAIVTANSTGSVSNPRVRPAPQMRVELPIVEATTPPFTGQLPNVGMEGSWVTLDGEDFYFDGNEIVSGLEPDHPVIDNNVDDPNNYQDIPLILKQAPAQAELSDPEVLDDSHSFQEAAFDNEYVVIVNGLIVSSGTLEVVESVVKRLVFGEHELNQQYKIDTDDIIVFKRVKIKVGVFIE